jgi:hypothetical protein
MRMKLFAVGFLIFSCLPALANEYNGEKILNYLPVGNYVGTDCSIQVEESGSNKVIVSVQSNNDIANFNSSLLQQKEISESFTPSEYLASFILIPNDSYSGLRANWISIKKQNMKTVISVKMKRRFLGVWQTDRFASCTLKH